MALGSTQSPGHTLPGPPQEQGKQEKLTPRGWVQWRSCTHGCPGSAGDMARAGRGGEGARDPRVPGGGEGTHLQALSVVQQGAGGAVAALLAPPGEAGDAAGEVGAAVGAALARLALTVQPPQRAARLCAGTGLRAAAPVGVLELPCPPHRASTRSPGSCAGTWFAGATPCPPHPPRATPSH